MYVYLHAAVVTISVIVIGRSYHMRGQSPKVNMTHPVKNILPISERNVYSSRSYDSRGAKAFLTVTLLYSDEIGSMMIVHVVYKVVERQCKKHA
jgi:hypothetical protein